jgi:chromosome partitioning protein
MGMARIISICNQKGGVGKTTTSVNLGSYLAALGRRVLLVDFDPQANASSALGSDPMQVEESIYHGVINAVPFERVLKPTTIFNFHFVPAAPHLAGALIEFVNLPEREYFLRKFLNRLRHQYDYIFIDLPPSLSLLTVNGLVASDEVIIPVQAEYYSLEGLGQLLQTVKMIQDNLDHRITVTGALLTMYNRNEKLSREIAKNLRQHFPHPVFKTEIPRSIALAEAPSFSKPIMLYRPDSIGAIAYKSLADELIAQEQNIHQLEPKHVSPNFGNFNVI